MSLDHTLTSAAAPAGTRTPVGPAAAPGASGPAATTSLAPPRRAPVRPVLWIALVLSLAVHVAWSLWPAQLPTVPEDRPLTATLTELPPPPKVAAPAPAVPKARSRRASAPAAAAPIPGPVPSELPAAGLPAEAAPAPVVEPVAEAAAPAPVPDAEPPAPDPKLKTLPPRVDLAYKVFLGTQGFLIGDATYRFEHGDGRYRISTVAQARGLAALIVHGQGKVESRGLITPAGLQPQEFSIERGSADRRESARFDWDAGVVILHDDKTVPLEPPIFDPMTLMWQPYFTPPEASTQTFHVAYTRRVVKYTAERQDNERIAWNGNDIDTERWHWKSDDGLTESWFWLAPSLQYIPLKLRVTRTARGTLEILLDTIRVDEARPQ